MISNEHKKVRRMRIVVWYFYLLALVISIFVGNILASAGWISAITWLGYVLLFDEKTGFLNEEEK